MPPSLRLGYEAMHDIRVAAMSKLLTEDEMRELRKTAESKYPWIRVHNPLYSVELITTYKVTFKDKQTEEELWNS